MSDKIIESETEDVNLLYKLLSSDYGENPIADKGSKMVEKIEDEYMGVYVNSEAEKSRNDEKEQILNKINSLKKKLRFFKNIKNPRMVDINRKRFEKRKEINRKISILEFKLDEINKETM